MRKEHCCICGIDTTLGRFLSSKECVVDGGVFVCSSCCAKCHMFVGGCCSFKERGEKEN